MNNRKKYFLAGAAAAGFWVASTFEINSLEALSKIPWKSYSPEIRLAYDLGLINPSFIQSDLWDSGITRRNFSVGLAQALQLIGCPAGSTLRDLEESGIFKIRSPELRLSRREAIEALCRAANYLSENGFISLGVEGRGKFADYKVPNKLKHAMGFLEERKIVKGYQDGKLHVLRQTSNREAICLLYRFYEQTSMAIAHGKKREGCYFVDLPMDHPIMESVNLLEKAGAFEFISLGSSFDGYNSMTVGDAAGMVSGVLKRCQKGAFLGQIQNIIRECESSSFLTRGKLVFLMEILIKSANVPDGNEIEIAYCDVSTEAKETIALESLAKAGIKFGYSDGRFAGHEVVSRIEIVKTIEAVIKQVGLSPSEEEPVSQLIPTIQNYPVKTDFENFSNMIRSKQAFIHKLLTRKAPHRR
ncbi:S-layer homology domain-containing protein [bacterium]|nr:S-layer homology domain-containing protein [bacterium]